MTKPLDEKWIVAPIKDTHVWATDGALVADCNPLNQFGSGRQATVDRARLAACAPEAVRLLLALDDKTKPCPSCANNRHRSDHDPDCELDAVLRKAGVR